MKEIKFRAWIKSFREMFYDAVIFGDDLLVSLDGIGLDTVGEYKDSDFHVMQYTGLKDKNSKEIYEGDIIKYIIRKPMLPEYHVVESIGDFGDMKTLEELSKGAMSSVEVIGNIHENPELIRK